MFPWVLSCWNAGIPYSFSCKLGGFFVNFLLEAAPFASVFEKLTLLTFTVPVCAEREQRRGNDFHAGRAPALNSSCLGVAGFPGLGVTKVLFLSTVQSQDHHPVCAGSQAQPGFHQKFSGKEVAILCCLTFPKKTSSIFQSWEQVLLGQMWVALVYQVCSLDVMMAIKTDAAFEQFTWWLCAWHCCRAGANAALEIPLQHFGIYFWAKQVVPTPISLLSVSGCCDLSLSLFPTSVSGERS